MGYYIRIFSPSDVVPTLPGLKAVLAKQFPDARIDHDPDVDNDWEQIALIHSDGTEIAAIERNPVESESLGTAEIAEFMEDIQGCEPASAVEWLLNYLPTVRTIYAFQLLSGTDKDNGWEIFGTFKDALLDSVGGIIQADHEGFSNEDGYHILWQFSDSVSGPWWMAVLQNGSWAPFRMELGDKKQREAFFRGEVPKDAKRKNILGFSKD